MAKKQIDVDSLPEDVEILKSIIKQQVKESNKIVLKINKQSKEIERLKAKLNRQLIHRFGQSTEKLKQLSISEIESLPVFSGKTNEYQQGDDEKELEPLPKLDPKAEVKPKRKQINQDNKLDEIEEVIEPSEQTPVCNNCKSTMQQFAQEESTIYDFVPASIKVRKIIRPKYCCKKCNDGKIQIADMPSMPIPKSNAGAGLLSDLLVSKYHDHLPIYRINKIYARQGVEINRSTLSEWILKSAQLLSPIVDYMLAEVLQSNHIFTDDTIIPVQNKKSKHKKGRLWVYIGDDEHAYTVFKYSPTRAGMYPYEILKNFYGYIHADAYSGYDNLFKNKLGSISKAFECSCWVHARRYFANIIKTGHLCQRQKKPLNKYLNFMKLGIK